jgi:hypothetical protein
MIRGIANRIFDSAMKAVTAQAARPATSPPKLKWSDGCTYGEKSPRPSTHADLIVPNCCPQIRYEGIDKAARQAFEAGLVAVLKGCPEIG